MKLNGHAPLSNNQEGFQDLLNRLNSNDYVVKAL